MFSDGLSRPLWKAYLTLKGSMETPRLRTAGLGLLFLLLVCLCVFWVYSWYESSVSCVAGKDFLLLSRPSLYSSASPFALQKHLTTSGLTCWFWGLSVLASGHSSSLSPTFSSSDFRVSGLTVRSFIHWELIFCRISYWDLVSLLCRWISSFPSTLCWRDCVFLCVFLASL